MPKVKEDPLSGALEYWSFRVLKKDIHLLSISPVLRHSIAPK
jgi:hypothetical protein